MAAKRPEGEGPMSPVDVIIVVAVAAAFVGCVRYLGKSQKNGCSDCGGGCSARGKGDCSAAKRMLADADRALARAKSCDCQR